MSVARASFELATAARIAFGAGKLHDVPDAVRELGVERVLLVTGRDPARAQALEAALRANGLELHATRISGEPSVERVREGVRELLALRCQAVVAFGGGSVIDAAKAMAALASNGGDPLDYLEVIGRGRALSVPSLPLIAIPTTAGTGAEVTRNAVLGDAQAQVKVSLRSPHMLPRLAVIDPDLITGTPPAVLRASGLDALSQLIEPYLSARANPLTDALARTGIERSARSLRRAVLTGPDEQAREDLALASLCGGLALANAGLGAVHGFAGPVGGMCDAPHGAVCAALLPHVLAINHRALLAREPASPVIARFDALGPLLTGERDSGAHEAIAWVSELCSALSVPGLASYGLREQDLPTLISKAKSASSMRGNPLPLTDAELHEVALRALQPASAPR